MKSLVKSKNLINQRKSYYHNIIRGPHESICLNTFIEFNLIYIDLFSPHNAIIYSTIGFKFFLSAIRFKILDLKFNDYEYRNRWIEKLFLNDLKSDK